MAFEPINIFSHRVDPRGVVDLLRATGKEVQVVGPDDDWQQVTVRQPKALLRKGWELTFGHDSEYYDGEGWPRQVFGMQNYFSGFPDAPRKQDVLRLIGTFRFALAVPQHDLNIDSKDERLAIVYAVCQHLDGVIFTPSSLRDAGGRVLFGAGGAVDPLAKMPAMPPAASDLDEADDDSDAEEEAEATPPPTERILKRAMVLAALSNRGLLEQDQTDIEELEDCRRDLVAWVESQSLQDEVEPDEWEVLQRPMRRLDRQSIVNATWRLEGLGVLAWYLGLYELPPYDELVDANTLWQSMKLYEENAAAELAAELRPRSVEEMADMADHLLALHWRVRDFSVRPQPMDFVEFSKKCWFGSFDIDKFRVVDGDMAIGEVSIAEAADDERSRVSSLASERHLAINWLNGYSTIYSETDTST